MRNFSSPLDQAGVTRLVIRSDASVPQETLVVRPAQSSRTDLVRQEWDWQALRDYVVNQITTRFGPFPRVPVKEAAIFKSFVERHGDNAQPIARYAFEIAGGMWKGAPVTIHRFCKGADPYFAEPILVKISDSK